MKTPRYILLAGCGVLMLSLEALAGVTVNSPVNNAEITSPFVLNASAATCASKSVTAMGYSFDNSSDTTIVDQRSIDTSVAVSSGTHTLHVKAWSAGGSCVSHVVVNVMAAATPLHHIQNVFLIVMENHNWSGDGSLDIAGNTAAPYINYTLLPMASYARNYNNPSGIHPSLPNYLWLEAGDTLGTKGDDGEPSQFSQSTSDHLTTLLEKAGISWRAYEEDITGTDCPLNGEGPLDPNGNPLYAPRHDPFVYFDDVTNGRNPKSANCISHVRPLSQLDTDLTNNTVARYNFITPNLCGNMHDTCGGDPIAHGDAWLKDHLPAILNSDAYRSGGVIFITWDEAAKGDGPLGMIVLSPFGKGNHYSNSVYYTHSSTLRTVQEIFGVYPYIRYASSATDLSDLFQVFP